MTKKIMLLAFVMVLFSLTYASANIYNNPIINEGYERFLNESGDAVSEHRFLEFFTTFTPVIRLYIENTFRPTRYSEQFDFSHITLPENLIEINDYVYTRERLTLLWFRNMNLRSKLMLDGFFSGENRQPNDCNALYINDNPTGSWVGEYYNYIFDGTTGEVIDKTIRYKINDVNCPV